MQVWCLQETSFEFKQGGKGNTQNLRYKQNSLIMVQLFQKIQCRFVKQKTNEDLDPLPSIALHCGGNVLSKTKEKMLDLGFGISRRKQIDLGSAPLREQVLRPCCQRAWLTKPGVTSPQSCSLSSHMISQGLLAPCEFTFKPRIHLCICFEIWGK